MSRTVTTFDSTGMPDGSPVLLRTLARAGHFDGLAAFCQQLRPATLRKMSPGDSILIERTADEDRPFRVTVERAG